MKYLYLHGFASGPASHKGVALERHLAGHGVSLERLDARVPSAERLRLSAVLDLTARAIGGADQRAVVFGSSLGGLAAARLAERDAGVRGLVLLAPGFRIASNFRRRMGEDAHRRWREDGWLAIHDYARSAPSRVDYGFYEDAAATDGPGELPMVHVPTLVIHGTADETCPVEASRAFAAVAPNTRLVEVDDGHELVASLPRIFEEVTAFLRGLGLLQRRP